MKRGRKGFLILLILAIIAVALTFVFINLFKEKDTKKLSEVVNKTVSEGYLNEESLESKKIIEYLTGLDSVLDHGEVDEKFQAINTIDGYKSMIVVVNFFNRELKYSVFSEEYKANRNSIEKDLSKGEELAEKVYKYIDEAEHKATGDWKANVWVGIKTDLFNMLKHTASAIDSLSKVYTGSISSKIMNNSFTDLLFVTFKGMNDKFLSDISKDDSLGSKLNIFANAYFSITGGKLIAEYQYNATLQINVKELKDEGTNTPALYSQFIAGNILG